MSDTPDEPMMRTYDGRMVRARFVEPKRRLKISL